MQLDLIGKEGSTDRAVSPVIGVILMVAITVILAAVIGTFVLDLGQDVGDSAPQASLSVSATGGDSADATNNATLTVNHRGGDALHSESTRIIVEYGTSTWTVETASTDDTFTVGNSVDIHINDSAGEIFVDPSGWDGYATASETHSEFTSGDAVSITLVDTTSQKVIFETEVTA